MTYISKYRNHILVWAFVTVYLCVTDPIEGNISVQILGSFFLIGNYILLYYFLYLFVVPKFYYKKYILGIALVAPGYLLFIWIDYFNFNVVMPWLGVPDYKGSYEYLAWNSLSSFSVVGAFAVASFLNALSIRKHSIQSEREKALITKELNFLKNQFNSHITFNFLNYCYSQVHRISETTGDAIDLFSSMLRYSLVISPGLKVPVESEIEYIRNFIQLQKLLSKNVHVKFISEGDFAHCYILPSVLITFIENAFTHGETTNVSSPIRIYLAFRGDLLTLEVVNRKRNGRKIGHTGVGLENVKQLLLLYYENKYQLMIDDKPDDFGCRLNLYLN